MSLFRRNAKRDANEGAIIAALRASGVMVRPVSGWGIPDLICGYRGRWHLVEIKVPKGRTRPAQEEFTREAWAFNLNVPTVRSVENALSLVKYWRDQ